jgi:hypothetical protein
MALMFCTLNACFTIHVDGNISCRLYAALTCTVLEPRLYTVFASIGAHLTRAAAILALVMHNHEADQFAEVA